MKMIIVNNYEEMSEAATELVADAITANPSLKLGLTTGNTPVGLYSRLCERYRAGNLLLNEVRVISTEEYLGVPPEDQRSLFSWLNRVFIHPCGIAPDRIIRMRGEDMEPQLVCEQFDEEIRNAGGIDLIVEGIGRNGHIGFNEPGSLPAARSRIVALTNETLDHNYQYWHHSVPQYGMTIGLATILAAKHIVLMASGASKAESLLQALTGPVTADVPASYLQNVPNVTVVADKEAAKLIVERQGAFLEGKVQIACRYS
ncbi:6-phosphogluconolactonase [Cohnella herbarum]|uniref:Glucosamine-6-phosphate deaminase n=1 Tax=Cohnella herbarum TaxID=2728023 RepID=A0A7Z2VPY7_9BACL|nr:glucosamine-6-phosphate deaminase [Cohnella herbarum]QJD87147.1 glucosamine-6-phosphate deaminase [Cohnella herbarum]